MFNCEFGPVCPVSIRGLTLEHLHNITDLIAEAEMCGNVFDEV